MVFKDVTHLVEVVFADVAEEFFEEEFICGEEVLELWNRVDERVEVCSLDAGVEVQHVEFELGELDESLDGS